MAPTHLDASEANSQHLPTVHLLVMGLTGAGKSTFIAKATGDDSIPTGEDLEPANESVTTEVKSYPMVYKGYEVSLIDSPGFDDDDTADDVVLKKIADFINNIHSLGWTIGGIIYIHDITRIRMGRTGNLNVRVLENMTGRSRWNYITLVTTKWGCSASRQGEEKREKSLQQNEKYWKAMREASNHARMCRFENTQASAREIIDWHIDRNFTPRITQQMVDQNLSLIQTDAGRVMHDKYAEIFSQQGNTTDLAALNARMQASFDGQQTQMAMQSLLADLHCMERKKLLQSVGKWAVRLTAFGGGLIATVLTENPTAFSAALALAGRLETSFRDQRAITKARIGELRNTITSTALYGGFGDSASISEITNE